MNRKPFIIATLSLVLPLAAMSEPISQVSNHPIHLSSHELRNLMQNAHDSAQYKQLGVYFRQQEAQSRAKAAAELIERNQRAQNTMGSAQKYPRPVDSAQYLYDSYVQSAEQAAAHAQHYEQLAAATHTGS